ncbi:ABC transporter substrate-binding protein [Pseudobacillus badius]|uniref:ABC transporter substrate-binding protein n=1 Tax=Bacillus badius TaxID=1455 RepID=UPI0009ED8A01|nr:ABC transporter substrate-binding protein [Bacillus badius]TDW02060.1 amino acid ABC transporter substrate-binding protein (PAAT family) [Bacillus badius]
MKNYRNYLICLFVLSLSLFIAACGSKTENQDSGQDNEQKTFRYAMSGLYKPFNFKEGGQLAGFDVEIGQALAKKMNMKAEPVTNPWETIIQGLQSNKYDAILGSMAVTEERKKAVSFTTPYYRSGTQIFVAQDQSSIKSANDLKGKKIGVVKASPYKDLAEKYTDKVQEYDSDLTALLDITTGRLDAVITDQMVGFRVMKEKTMKIKDVGKPLTYDEMAIAVRKDDKELEDKLNKALAEMIEDGTYEKISDKWFGRNIYKND